MWTYKQWRRNFSKLLLRTCLQIYFLDGNNSLDKKCVTDNLKSFVCIYFSFVKPAFPCSLLLSSVHRPAPARINTENESPLNLSLITTIFTTVFTTAYHWHYSFTWIQYTASYNICWRHILILSYHLWQCLPICLFLVVLPAQILGFPFLPFLLQSSPTSTYLIWRA